MDLFDDTRSIADELEEEKADQGDHDMDPLLLNVGDHQETSTVYKCEECNLVFRSTKTNIFHVSALKNLLFMSIPVIPHAGEGAPSPCSSRWTLS